MTKSQIMLIPIMLIITLILWNCGKNASDTNKYNSAVEQQRQEINDWMKNDPNSPFNYKGKVDFHSLNYFEPNPEFIFTSKLTEYITKDTVVIFGTKGEERKAVRYGYLILKKEGNEYKLSVYETVNPDFTKYYSIWFTDKTTNNSTYGVGRYLPFELSSDKDFNYTIDFNFAYNPYCAYSADYSCAIPTKEDYIDLAIEAGEKKFHD
ncbi:MAG: DUF1684 domain-containing protein [Ignavibacteriae bacterium]|nr:DUF1684 domain-containing protein [Ignavibacteriota bacterium]MCB9207522.1 DUF1684 domain-containing protein [Ignavibacteriales bacterium]MCB0752621.1 DUF1684 domain-containing protein [Ignavibacteriota bacterium]MCB9209069.1 DUF1684 domain-containing protein [Ignavibacteriales bacterium]MCB9218010.1 DUF1684 domain-containing protein [Ignavibacteriales bacterium]